MSKCVIKASLSSRANNSVDFPVGSERDRRVQSYEELRSYQARKV